MAVLELCAACALGAPGGSGRLATLRGEAGPLSGPPPPRLLEPAASDVACAALCLALRRLKAKVQRVPRPPPEAWRLGALLARRRGDVERKGAVAT